MPVQYMPGGRTSRLGPALYRLVAAEIVRIMAGGHLSVPENFQELRRLLLILAASN